MRIVSLEVKGYKRFHLAPELHHFKYVPSEKLQVIIGSNGVGKSSLLSLLYLVPVDIKELSSDGFVKIIVEKDNLVYELYASREKGNHYSFKQEGEELNISHKITVQKSLIKTHFKLDARIFAVLSNQIKFTGMSPLERRKWLTELSETDYDYVMKVFTKIKDRQSFLGNVIKHNTKRLVTEKDKMVSVEELPELQKSIKNKKDQINALLDKKVAIQGQVLTEQQMLDLNEIIRTKIKELYETTAKLGPYIYNNNMDITSIDLTLKTLSSTITELETKLSGNSNYIKDLYEELEELSRGLADVDIGDIKSRDSLEKDLKDIEKQKSSIQSKLYEVYRDDNLTAVSALNSLIPDISHVLSDVKTNEDLYYSRVTIENNDNRLCYLREKESVLEFNLQELTLKDKELNHLKSHGQITCPECNNQWYESYDSNTHEKVKSEMVSVGDEIASLSKEILVCENYLKEAHEYFDHIRLFYKITKANTVLKSLWEKIESESLLTKSPSRIVNTMVSYKQQCEIMASLDKLNNQIDRIKDLLHVHDSIDEGKHAVMRNSVSKVESSLEKEQSLSQELIEDIKYNKHIYGIFDLYKEQFEELRSLVNKRVEAHNLYLTNLEQRSINASIADLNDKISSSELDMGRMSTQSKMILSLEEQISELDSEKEIIDDLIKEMSPTSGLIAKSLLGFIQTLVLNINTCISDMWAYSLYLHPPGMDEEGEATDLNYKFKVTVADQDPNNDITELSVGQMEVVNLAFKLAFMDKIGMNGYPLILDEVAASMDEVHRLAAYRYVEDNLTTRAYTNIFVVSHYKELFNIFSECSTEYTVLDKYNIDTSELSPSINRAIDYK